MDRQDKCNLRRFLYVRGKDGKDGEWFVYSAGRSEPRRIDPATYRYYVNINNQERLSWASFLTSNGMKPGEVSDVVSKPHHGSENEANRSIGLLKSWMARGSIRGYVNASFRKMVLERRLDDDQPPRVAQFTLLLIPQKSREHLIGDLEEEYRMIVLPDHGRFWARVWYWEQTALALGFYVWPLVKRLLGLAAVWKVIGR